MRRDLVRVSRREVEEASAVVQHDTRVARDDAGAEVAEQRLDQRDDVALPVGNGHVDRVAEVTAGQLDVFILIP